MKINEILSPELIAPNLAGNSKSGILHELATLLASKHREIDLDDLNAVLGERERLGSTAIGDGIAIPHGKVSGARQILGTFGRHVQGVNFESLDGKPSHLFFMLVAPEDSSSLHLKALARVSRLFKDASFRDRLLKAGDAREVFR